MIRSVTRKVSNWPSLRRFARLGVGVALLGLVGVVVYRRFLLCHSMDAVVGARLYILRTPIDGYVNYTDAHLRVGQLLRYNQRVATVENHRVLSPSLNDARERLKVVEAEAAALGVAIGERSQRHTGAHAASEVSLDIVARRLKDRSEHEQSALEALSERRGQLVTLVDRASTLAAQGLATDNDVLKLRTELTQTEADIQHQAIEVADARLALAGNDSLTSTYARQRDVQLQENLTDMRVRAATLQAQATILEDRIETESEALARETSASLDSPVGGQVWDVQAPDGTFLRKGDTVLRLASCSDPLVVAFVNARNFGRIRRGTHATFRDLSTHEHYDAIVVQKLGFADMNQSSFQYAAPGLTFMQEEAKVFLVILEFSAPAARQRCELGSYGDVEFKTSPNPF